MRKRTREISVDGRHYLWSVIEREWPNAVLRVWQAEHPRIVWLEAPLEVTAPITPQQVAERIREHWNKDSV